MYRVYLQTFHSDRAEEELLFLLQSTVSGLLSVSLSIINTILGQHIPQQD